MKMKISIGSLTLEWVQYCCSGWHIWVTKTMFSNKTLSLLIVNYIYSCSYNLGQNCWENCILGQHFSKHRSCTGSSLSPFPWKQCCYVFKRKPGPWAFVGGNIELGEGVSFRKGVVLEIVLLCRKVDMMGKPFSSSFVWDCIWLGKAICSL